MFKMLYKINLYAQIRNILYGFAVLREIANDKTIISAYYMINEKTGENEPNPVFKYGALYLFIIMPDDIDKTNVRKYLGVQTKMLSDILMGSDLFGIVKESTSFETVRYIGYDDEMKSEEYAVIKFFPNYSDVIITTLIYAVVFFIAYFLIVKQY